MSPTTRRNVLAIVFAGTLVRLFWAATTPGVVFDIGSARLAAETLSEHGSAFYAHVNDGRVIRWPYPPGYLPWTLLSDALSGVVAFRFVVGLPAIAADAALALLVARILSRRQAEARLVVGGAALVSFGPIFALTSGFHGQIDSVAILPAVVALDRWQAGSQRHRALVAGVLIGVAASLKSPVGIILLALLPTARDRREALTLASTACATVVAGLLPFLLSAPRATKDALSFSGIAGEGGLSLVVQPDLARRFLRPVTEVNVTPSDATLFIADRGPALLVAVVLVLAVLLWRRRTPPATGAALLFTTAFVLGSGFAPRYAVWLLPILLLDGRLRAALVLQAALLVPDGMVYGSPINEGLVPVYITVGIAIWAGLVVWWARQLACVADARPPDARLHARAAHPRDGGRRPHPARAA